jgi:hypothetical protein
MAMFAKLGHAVALHPWRVIAAWAVAGLVLTDIDQLIAAEAPTGSSTPPSSTSTAGTEP